MADSDGPEWILYDADFKTALRILKGSNASIYLKLNDPGSGTMTLMLSDPAVADIALGRYVGFSYRGAYRGGFLIENINRTTAIGSEGAGRAITISGRGALALLDDAVVWDYFTPPLENIRYFGTLDVYSPYGGAPISKGKVLYYLLKEARDWNSAPGGTLDEDRYCWHLEGLEANPYILDWSFTDAVDTATVGWAGTEELEFPVGTSYLDVIRKLDKLGYDFTITRNPATGVFMLNAYQTRRGTDLSATIVFRVGRNCSGFSDEQAGGGIKNALLVEFSDPAIVYTVLTNPLSMLDSRRKESVMQSSDASTESTALNYGSAELSRTEVFEQNVNIGLSDAITPNLFIDYNLGDTVGFDDGTGVLTDHRITGVQLSWEGDNQYADIVLEIDTSITPPYFYAVIYTDSVAPATFDPSWTFSDASVMTVKWGDGTPEESHATGLTHTYSSAGTKRVLFKCLDWSKLTTFDINTDTCVKGLPTFATNVNLEKLNVGTNLFTGTLPSFATCVKLMYLLELYLRFQHVIYSNLSRQMIINYPGHYHRFHQT